MPFSSTLQVANQLTTLTPSTQAPDLLVERGGITQTSGPVQVGGGFQPERVVTTTSAEATFTDRTDAANLFSGAAFTSFPTGAVGDRLYIGVTRTTPNGVYIDVATAGDAGAAATWEGWTGAAFVALTVTDGTAVGGIPLRQDGSVTWTDTLALTTINGLSAYWIRLRVTTLYTTNPTIVSIMYNRIDQDGLIVSPLGWDYSAPLNNVSGTYLGVDAPTGFNGNVFDAHVGGVSVASIDSTGIMTMSGLALGDDDYLIFGDGSDARIGWNTAQTVDAWYFGTSAAQNTLLIAEDADRAFDFAHGAQTNPTLFGHSAVQNTTQWWSLTHDQTTAVFGTGLGGVSLTPATITSGGTNDFGLQVAQTLNDAGAAGGTDVYRALYANLTTTNTTGWNNVYLLDLVDDATSRFLVRSDGRIVHGVPTLIGGQTGDLVTFTTSGGGAGTVAGHGVTLDAGYTGSGFTVGLYADNAVAGTNTAYSNGAPYGYRPSGNRGDTGYARATTTGHNAGGVSLAANGSYNWAMWAASTIAKAGAVNVGLAAFGLNTGGGGGIGIGAFISLESSSSVPTVGSESVVLVLDNNSQAAPIASFRDNTVEVFSVEDFGTFIWTPTASTSGTQSYMIFTSPTDTGLTASTEVIGHSYSGANKTWAAGNITTQREWAIGQPTYTIAGGASSFTNTATLTIVGAPTMGVGTTSSNNDALWLTAGTLRMADAVRFTTGTAVVAGQYSIQRDADGTNQLHANVPTGATYEWSINDGAELTLSATTLGLATNTITGIGSAVTGTAGTALTMGPANSSGTAAGTNVTIHAGDASTTGSGGNVILDPGAAAGGGANVPGVVQIFSGSSGSSIGEFSSSGAGIFSIQPAAGISNIEFSISGATAAVSLNVSMVASSVNYLQAAGAVAGAEPILSAQGTDTDIDITMTPKGGGDVAISAGGLRISGGRIQGLQGADVASGTSLTLLEGNVFEVTGTTQIDQILTTGWQEGSMVTLIFNESVTVRHGIATSGANVTILLAASGNLSATANDTLTVVLSSTTAGGQAWREVARTVI